MDYQNISFTKLKSAITLVPNFPYIATLRFTIQITVKPVLNGHSKIDNKKIIMTNGSIMKVKSIAEYSRGAFCNTFDLH